MRRNTNTGILEAAARAWVTPERDESLVDCLGQAIAESKAHTLRLESIRARIEETNVEAGFKIRENTKL
jgi:hypothetical protein